MYLRYAWSPTPPSNQDHDDAGGLGSRGKGTSRRLEFLQEECSRGALAFRCLDDSDTPLRSTAA